MKQHLLISFLLSLSLLSLGQNVPSYVPTNGLVGWWPFNGNANDESGNGNNLTVVGPTLTNDRLGSSNSAYLFQGIQQAAQYLINNQLNSFKTPQYSLSVWFKLNSFYPLTTANGPYDYANWNYLGIVAVNSNNWSVGPAISMGINSNVKLLGGGHWTTSLSTGCTYSNVITTQTWYNLTATYDGTKLRMFIDGNLQCETDAPLSFNNQYDLTIGGQRNGTAMDVMGGFKGIIDDFAWWNRALTQQEITNLYNASVPPPPCNPLPSNLQTGLVGYWPFCGNANDESGNGNNGTVNGATLTVDRFGDSGRAYSFDGINDNIRVDNSTSLNISNQYSIQYWINYDSSSNYQYKYIAKKGIAGQNGNIYCRLNVDYYSEHMKFDGSSFNKVTTKLPIIANNWTHIIHIFDGNHLSTYINGVLSDTTNTSSLYLNNSYPLYFGSDEIQGFYSGKIDDIAIWSRSLSPSEISLLYQISSSNTGKGNVGINVAAPQRSLHVKDVIRLEPRNSAPENPVFGDMYLDGVLKKLRVFDGTTWQNCW